MKTETEIYYDADDIWSCWVIVVSDSMGSLCFYTSAKPTKRQVRKIKKDSLRILAIDRENLLK